MGYIFSLFQLSLLLKYTHIELSPDTTHSSSGNCGIDKTNVGKDGLCWNFGLDYSMCMHKHRKLYFWGRHDKDSLFRMFTIRLQISEK